MMRYWRAGLTAVVIAAGVMALPGGVLAQGASMVALEPAVQTVAYGSGNVAVQLMAHDVPTFASFEVIVRYDSTRVSFASFTRGPFITSTGRQVQCPQLILGADTVQAGCYTFGSTIAAPSGSGLIGTFSFTTIASGRADLVLELAAVSDYLSIDVPVARQGASITITGGPTSVPATPSSGTTPASGNPGPAATPAPAAASGEILPGPGATAVAGQTGVLPASDTPAGTGRTGEVGGNQSGADGAFPVAGYGPPSESGDQALAGQVWALAAIGAALAAAGGLLRFRAGARHGSSDA